MEPNDVSHAACFAQPRSRKLFYQARIVFSPRFGFALPPRLPPPLSPTPNAVRRITHTPFYSTTDRTLTSFFRLPYDIRIQIYRYLVSGVSVSYRLCPATSRLVLYRQYCRSIHYGYPYVRHGLFPAILACSKLCHEEGGPILYRENIFCAAWCAGRPNQGPWEVLNSWPLAVQHMMYISRLEMSIHGDPDQSEGVLVLGRQSAVFPALRFLTLSIQLSILEWERFCDLCAHVLRGLEVVKFRSHLSNEEAQAIWYRDARLEKELVDGRWEVFNADVLCYELYEPALRRHNWFDKRNSKWRFHDWGNDYGLNWNVELDLS